MWYNLPKIIAHILCLMQMLVLNVSHGKYTEPEKSEKEEAPLINDISGDTSFADSSSSLLKCRALAYAMENTDINFFCFC